MRKIVPNIILFYFLLFFFSCSFFKKYFIKKPEITFCDTILNYINKNEFILKPKIFELDPQKKVYQISIGGINYYQFKFSKITYFDKYVLLLDDIPFNFKLDTSDCKLIGDKVICLLDVNKLSEECLRRGIGKSTNGYDCIYRHDWSIKVRGITCDKFYGPSSDEIKNISLQCNPPSDD